jgi:hypothetical protein
MEHKTNTVPDALVERLVDEITPLNNLYRQAVRKHRPPYEVLGFNWDIGEALKQAGVDEPYPIAVRIQEVSYITRDLVTFSWRVRRYFTDRRTIKRRFGKVVRLSAFRWSLPLLEGGNYYLSRAKERELVRLVNSDLSYAEMKHEIDSFKQKKLPTKPSHDRKPHNPDSFAVIFERRLSELEAIMRSGSRSEILRFREIFDSPVLLYWNKLCLAFADEAFAPPGQSLSLQGLDLEWAELINGMYEIVSEGRVVRNRARRGINRMDFLTMGNYIGILRDPEKLDKHLAV